MSKSVDQMKQDEEIFFIISERLRQPNALLTENVQAFFDSFKEIYNINQCGLCQGNGRIDDIICPVCDGLGEEGYREDLKRRLVKLK